MIAKFNIIVKNNVIKKGTEAEIIEEQYIESLNKTYYTVKTSSGFVYLTTKRGLLNQYKGVILPNSEEKQEEVKPMKKPVQKPLKTLNARPEIVQPKSESSGEQIQLF